jgi:hypothetical protein
MPKKQKLLERFLKRPNDFTWKETQTLLLSLGYEMDNKGKTSGSRILFYYPSCNYPLRLHKPHNPKILRKYHFDAIIKSLKEVGLI